MSQVIVRRKQELADDELMHFKYSSKEKKNGKWVYYYGDKQNNSLKSKYEDFKNETSREAQNHAYNLAEKVYKKSSEKAVKNKDYKKALSLTVKRGGNLALKILNNIGKGKLDDSAAKHINNGKKYLNKLFGNR